MTERLIRTATVAVLAAGMALAQTPAARPGPRGARPGIAQRGMLQRGVMRNLNLTDSQKQQAKAIFDQTRENTKPIREQLRQNREALRAAMQANDTVQIQNLSAQQGTLRGQVMAAQAEAQAKFKAILTPDQLAKLADMRQKAKNRMQRMQNRGQNRGGNQQ